MIRGCVVGGAVGLVAGEVSDDVTGGVVVVVEWQGSEKTEVLAEGDECRLEVAVGTGLGQTDGRGKAVADAAASDGLRAGTTLGDVGLDRFRRTPVADLSVRCEIRGA